jgi:hypothetical protein
LVVVSRALTFAESIDIGNRRPLTSPNVTNIEVVGKVIRPRQIYHFGSEKISMYLKRYYDIELSVSGVWRILKRLDTNPLPTSRRYVRHQKRWELYEKPQQGHAVQIDVKFVAPIGGREKALLPVHRYRRLHQAADLASMTR